MIISFNTDSLEAFAGIMKRVEEKSPEIIDNALMKAGFLVEREAKKLTPVKTGRLRASIAVESLIALRKEKHVAISPHTDYADYVHRRVPFMTAGYYTAKGRIDELFADIVVKELSNFN